MDKITEQESYYRHLEKMSLGELLTSMNDEDKKVPEAVGKAIGQIEKVCAVIADRMMAGGRLIYIGAGTSGRLGIVDASECPPTFGVPHGLVLGIIAGGDGAIRNAVEFAEDDTNKAWLDLQGAGVNSKDVVLGISASGSTPYVLGGLKKCKAKGIATSCMVCNPNSSIAETSDFPIEVIVGPEFVTGSTRMKSGTATKLVLNMITTAVMIQLGRVEDNKMVNMQLSNHKLVERGVNMLVEKTNLPYQEAKQLLLKEGSVKLATEVFLNKSK